MPVTRGKRKIEEAAAAGIELPEMRKPVEKVPRPPRRERKKRVPAKVKTSSGEEITHWLLISEPDKRFQSHAGVKLSIEEIKAYPDQTVCWDGVRNYLSRNFMMKGMKLGHKILFYHNDANDPGIAGICEVARESYVDHTQFDPSSPYFDQHSTIDNPRWYMVDIKFDRMMKRFLPFSELKALHQIHKDNGGPLRSLSLFTKSVLLVQPITEEEWDFIVSLEDQ